MIPTIYVLSTNVTFDFKKLECTSTPLALSKRGRKKTVPLFDLLPHEHADALNLAAEMNAIVSRKP